MQMTFDQAMRPGILQAFAFRKNSGYVMRSEKRPGYGSAGGGHNNRNRKPKRQKAGILYILLTLLILLVVWPVGIVMLWRRKVRMQAGTKLLISLLTLCISVFLIVFGLTVHVDNPRYTEFQDKANDWLNKAAADMAVAGDAAYKKGTETWDVMTEFADNAAQPVLNTMADGIDKAVALTGKLRDKIAPTGEPTEAPDTTEDIPSGITPSPEATEEAEPTEAAPEEIQVIVPETSPDPDSATPLSAGMLTAAGEFKPGEMPEATETPEVESTPEISEAPEASDVPEATEDVEAAATGEDHGTPEPSAVPEDDEAIDWIPADGSVEEAEAPTAEPTEAPTAEPTSTPGPTATPEPDIPVKAAGEATVYYNKDGKLYHMQSSCKKMESAKAHTLAEAIADGKEKCNACGSPDASILEVKDLVWADEGKVFHTTDECEKFEGKWKLISLADAIADNYTACPDCQADIFAAVNAEPTPTPEPTEAPTPEPTATPEPETVTPATTLKPVGEATVYHSSNGKFYHRFKVCKGMSGSKAFKLSEITSKYKRCKTCDAPATDMVGKTCLWMDEKGLCHTSDECDRFEGNYSFILRDDALEQGKTGCPDCGADEYLVPNTVLAE